VISGHIRERLLAAGFQEVSEEIPTYRLFTADADVEKPNLPPQDIPGPAANTKQERELRVFAKLLSRGNDKNRSLLPHMA
jgi:hypothetical protein